MFTNYILDSPFFTSVFLFVGIPLSFWLIVKIMEFIHPSKCIYERNRRASILCIRVNRKEKLPTSEKNDFEKFISDGVIEKNSNGIFELSDRARIELFEKENPPTST